MSKYTVGKDVISYCSKCKLNLSHIVMVLRPDGTPHKVQCNTCRGQQVFKSDPATRKVVGAKRKIPGTKRKVTRPLSEEWQELIDKSDQKTQDYSIRTQFTKGDIINHKNFGMGVVENIVDNDKINVMFKNEYKILVHGR